MPRITDRIALLEKLLAPPVAEPARMFTVRVCGRLLDDYDAVIAEARAACGQPLAPDAVPLLDGSHDDWAEYAPRHQARLIAIGQAHMDAVAEREGKRKEADNRKRGESSNMPVRKPSKPPPKPFVHVPSVFDTRA
jgi:hypothetical protein